jgi:hypothetical protein
MTADHHDRELLEHYFKTCKNTNLQLYVSKGLTRRSIGLMTLHFSLVISPPFWEGGESPGGGKSPVTPVYTTQILPKFSRGMQPAQNSVVLWKSSAQLVYVVVGELYAWFTQYNASCKLVAYATVILVTASYFSSSVQREMEDCFFVNSLEIIVLFFCETWSIPHLLNTLLRPR